jgi:hypothetical protein
VISIPDKITNLDIEKKDIQSLKDEINRLKGEKGNDKIVNIDRSESFCESHIILSNYDKEEES